MSLVSGASNASNQKQQLQINAARHVLISRLKTNTRSHALAKSINTLTSHLNTLDLPKQIQEIKCLLTILKHDPQTARHLDNCLFTDLPQRILKAKEQHKPQIADELQKIHDQIPKLSKLNASPTFYRVHCSDGTYKVLASLTKADQSGLKLLTNDKKKRDMLGTGGTAVARLVIAPDGTLYALKKAPINDKRSNSFGLLGPEKRRELSIDEAKQTMPLQHPNIMQTYGWFEGEGTVSEHDENFNTIPGTKQPAQKIYQLVEYADFGDLFELQNSLDHYRIPLEHRDVVVAPIAKDLAAALAYIHEKKMIHCDIKLENCLLTTKGQLKLADFGLSKHTTDSIEKLKVVAGTLHYLAPECDGNTPITPAADVWAFGLVLYELLTNKLPYEVKQPLNPFTTPRNKLTPTHVLGKRRELIKYMATKIDNKKFSEPTDKASLMNLIYHCLHKDPTKRPAMAQALKHPSLQISDRTILHRFLNI